MGGAASYLVSTAAPARVTLPTRPGALPASWGRLEALQGGVAVLPADHEQRWLPDPIPASYYSPDPTAWRMPAMPALPRPPAKIVAIGAVALIGVVALVGLVRLVD